MSQKSATYGNKRTARTARRQRTKNKSYVLWGGIGLLVLLFAGGVVWLLSQPAAAASAAPMGDVVQVNSRDHIAEGSDPGPYSSDPPAGGHHYPSTYQPGFYTEQAAATLPQFHQGYLVHNLEHGYVIYWYNCQADPKISCDALQNAIQQVMKENNYFKVIGFPWPSQKEPLAITSWGRILRLNSIDLNAMRAFYKSNVDKGPEQTPN